MTRIIVHAGFHKTGTSSLQAFFNQNRGALRPWLDYYGQADFHSVGTHARRFAQRPFPWRRLIFRRALRRFLASIPDADTVVLSRETFAGVMPGHRDIFRRPITGYTGAAIPLAREIIRGLNMRFGPDADIRFLYTCREPKSWLRSVYGHLLRSIHLRQGFDTFSQSFLFPPNPERDAQSIATAIAPIPVYIARLEDFTDQHEGTAAAILDLLDIPDEDRDRLLPAPHSNQGQSPAIEREFLRLNRSGQRKSTLKKLKDRILEKGKVI